MKNYELQFFRIRFELKTLVESWIKLFRETSTAKSWRLKIRKEPDCPPQLAQLLDQSSNVISESFQGT